ncbi:MAG: ANTAR domain-containing protein [Clostridia bacterium]|nr:ANTAR domain-containing protein [Clostridia bacterium]
MSLKERIYSVLVVSAADKPNNALVSMLPESHYGPVQVATSISAAKRLFSERSFDFVIINSPLPDDVGTKFAVDAGSTAGTVVLLIVRAEDNNDIRDKVTEYGVFTIPKPLSKPVLSLALDWMASTREHLRKLEKKTLSVEEKMEEIRIVNRAKWLLISELKMNEPQAHRYIEKQAMDRCVPRRTVAEEIIRIYS